ncbi:MAG: hypothetical protein EA382_00060, partial [Spirochaetaceae bacterium]
MDIKNLAGTWECILEESDEVGRFGAASMEIEVDDSELRMRRIARGARMIDPIVCRLDGTPLCDRPAERVIPDLFTSGIYRNLAAERTVTGRSDRDGFTVCESLELSTSQGSVPAQIEYRLEPADPERLTLTLTRSTIPDDRGTVYRFRRSGVRNAWYMELGDNWEIGGDLSRHAMLISLQALANRKSPRFYLVYPKQWDFKFTPAVLDYLKTAKRFSFSQIRTPEEAVTTFRGAAKGYVVWDRAVRTSLIVAFTIAGVEDAIVVSDAEIELAERMGLRCIADLREEFDGLSDAQIYRWAYDRYWDRCSRDYIV